jgi:His/Glu/Gln/Arg/opine family amino acid ABC transporter permease subunit
MIDFSIIWSSWPYLLQGTLITLQIATLASCIGIILGTILGIAQTYGSALTRSAILGYVTIVRGTPMLIQISFAYYLLPQIGLSLPPLWAAIMAIGLNSAAYISQIIRSGIQSVPVGQQEAARVLGLTRLQTIRYITLPQAVRAVIPALLNEFITLLKDSSLASIIGVPELFKRGYGIAIASFNPIPMYCAIAAIYLVLTTSLSLVAAYLERKMQTHVNHN